MIEGTTKPIVLNIEEETAASTYVKYANLCQNWYKWIGVLLLFIAG